MNRPIRPETLVVAQQLMALGYLQVVTRDRGYEYVRTTLDAAPILKRRGYHVEVHHGWLHAYGAPAHTFSD